MTLPTPEEKPQWGAGVNVISAKLSQGVRPILRLLLKPKQTDAKLEQSLAL